jgi:hypothetical protein
MTLSAALPDSAFPDRAPHIPVLLTPLLAAVAPVETPDTSASDARVAELEAQVKTLSEATAAPNTGTDPALAETLQNLSKKLDSMAQQVESLDQRTSNLAMELQNRSSANDAPRAKIVTRAAPKPVVKKHVTKPRVTKPIVKKPVMAKPNAQNGGWELRSAQPGVAWVGRSGSADMNRYTVGQTIPGVGTIQSVLPENGVWVVRTSGGMIRQ